MNETTRTSLNAVFGVEAQESPVESLSPVAVTGTILPAPAASTETSPMDPDDEEALRQAKEDFAFSRGAIKSIANDAQQSLIRAVEVAEQTDTARAFEAVAAMVRASLDAHKELHHLHKTAVEQRMALKSSNQKTETGSGVNIKNGIVFQGTTAELLRQLKPERT